MADSHTTGPPLTAVGVVFPLSRLKPGLDQPPPGTGEGLLEMGMEGPGVPEGSGLSG